MQCTASSRTRPPCRAAVERNSAVRESGALRIEKEDLKDKLEEAGRKLDEVQNTVHIFFVISRRFPTTGNRMAGSVFGRLVVTDVVFYHFDLKTEMETHSVVEIRKTFSFENNQLQ